MDGKDIRKYKVDISRQQEHEQTPKHHTQCIQRNKPLSQPTHNRLRPPLNRQLRRLSLDRTNHTPLKIIPGPKCSLNPRKLQIPILHLETLINANKGGSLFRIKQPDQPIDESPFLLDSRGEGIRVLLEKGKDGEDVVGEFVRVGVDVAAEFDASVADGGEVAD